jgi:Fic family protein
MNLIASKWIWQLKQFPNFTWDQSALLAVVGKVRICQGNLLGKLSTLDVQARTNQQLLAWSADVLATSAIEGIKLHNDQIRSSVARRLGLTERQSKRNRDVDAVVDLTGNALKEWQQPLSVNSILDWHRGLFPGGDSILQTVRVGQLRLPEDDPMRIVSVKAAREIVHFEAPPAKTLNRLLAAFFSWYNSNNPAGKSTQLDGLLRAGIAHLWFEILHPFVDGNGRVGRAIIDHAIGQDLQSSERIFALSARLYARQDDYYGALERASATNLDISPWLFWFLDQLKDAYFEADSALQIALSAQAFWRDRRQGESLSQRQHKVIRLLLDAGPDGFEGGMSTRKYANLCSVSLPTASRELTALARSNSGCPPYLLVTGSGRSTRYVIALDEPSIRLPNSPPN